MDLIELSKYLLDEKAAEEYLIEKGVIKTFGKCIRCESEKIGKVRREKIKCYDCKYEWKQMKGSILEECRISASKFLGLLKLFELEIPAYKAAKLMKVNEKVADKFYLLIRLTFFSELELKSYSKNYFEYSLRLVDDKIIVDFQNNLTNSYIIKLKRERNEHGKIVFELYFQDHRKASKYKSYIKGNETLLIFVRELNIKLRRLRKFYYQHLPHYVKEVEFRFNNRRNNIFNKLISSIVQKDI